MEKKLFILEKYYFPSYYWNKLLFEFFLLLFESNLLKVDIINHLFFYYHFSNVTVEFFQLYCPLAVSNRRTLICSLK